MPNDSKWNEWSLKVFEKLTTLNGRYEQLGKDIVQLEKNLSTQIDGINELLLGNGSPEKSIIVRLDRIEQNEVRRVWLIRTALVSCIGALVATVAQWLKG